MVSRTILLLIVLSFPLCIVGVVLAQESPETDENTLFTVGIGLGPAIANAVCEPCKEEKVIPGYSLRIGLGFRLGNRFIFDFGAGAWISTAQKQDPQNSRMNLLVRAYYFPFKKNRLNIIGGIGYGNYFFTPNKEAIITSSGIPTLGSVVGSGPVGTAGVGYEFKITDKLTLDPSLSFYGLLLGDLSANINDHIANKSSSIVAEAAVTLRYSVPP